MVTENYQPPIVGRKYVKRWGVPRRWAVYLPGQWTAKWGAWEPTLLHWLMWKRVD